MMTPSPTAEVCLKCTHSAGVKADGLCVWGEPGISSCGCRCVFPPAPEQVQCDYNPRELLGQPIGMFHCPKCGDMVLAGLPHPPPDVESDALDPETDAAFDNFLRTDPDVQAVLREKAAAPEQKPQEVRDAMGHKTRKAFTTGGILECVDCGAIKGPLTDSLQYPCPAAPAPAAQPANQAMQRLCAEINETDISATLYESGIAILRFDGEDFEVREVGASRPAGERQLFGELWVDKDGEAHFICHTKDENFPATKAAFEKFIALLQRQIRNEKECPFYSAGSAEEQARLAAEKIHQKYFIDAGKGELARLIDELGVDAADEIAQRFNMSAQRDSFAAIILEALGGVAAPDVLLGIVQNAAEMGCLYSRQIHCAERENNYNDWCVACQAKYVLFDKEKA